VSDLNARDWKKLQERSRKQNKSRQRLKKPDGGDSNVQDIKSQF
jgi:hypothetical protein